MWKTFNDEKLNNNNKRSLVSKTKLWIKADDKISEDIKAGRYLLASKKEKMKKQQRPHNRFGGACHSFSIFHSTIKIKRYIYQKSNYTKLTLHIYIYTYKQ